MNLRNFPPGGGKPEPPRPVETRRLLDQVAGELATELGRPLSLAIGSLPRVTLRPGHLREVFRHLLAEAAGGPPREGAGPIEVGCHLTEGHLRFFVRTLGGIPGCLTRVRELVEQEGGRAWVEGGGDAGATVWFSLPADPVPA